MLPLANTQPIILSVLVFLATRNALLVILSGMLALWSLRGLLLLF